MIRIKMTRRSHYHPPTWINLEILSGIIPTQESPKLKGSQVRPSIIYSRNNFYGGFRHVGDDRSAFPRAGFEFAPSRIAFRRSIYQLSYQTNGRVFFFPPPPPPQFKCMRYSRDDLTLSVKICSVSILFQKSVHVSLRMIISSVLGYVFGRDRIKNITNTTNCPIPMLCLIMYINSCILL